MTSYMLEQLAKFRSAELLRERERYARRFTRA
jgi:hypothetical protein